MKSLLKKLVEANGPSGAEYPVRDLIRSEIEPLADEVTVDALGNLIARLGEKSPQGMRVMLAAHMDELGVIATHIDDKGFIRFSPLGAYSVQTCLGARVQFMNGVRGIISVDQLDKPDQLPSFDQLFIDVGAGDRSGCPVRVGDSAAFDRPLLELGDRVVSKALDDRIGVAILIDLMRQLKNSPHQLFFAFTVQEEVGFRGSVTAAYGIDPDLGLAIDVTRTGDTPKGIKMDVALGAGPAVKVRDAGMLADPRIVNWIVKTAERAEIPYQMEILEGGSTDARSIQITRAGVPSGCVSIPCRYVHSSSEMVDWKDVQDVSRLFVELLRGPISLT